MPTRIDKQQRESVLKLLAEGQDRETIAALVGVTANQVAAVAAHVKMGRYPLPVISTTRNATQSAEATVADPSADCDGIFVGSDAKTGSPIHWFPQTAVNPHVLIVGESGSGKTYCILCLLAELSKKNVHSLVFDFGQGFSVGSLPEVFRALVEVENISASRDGVAINPLQLFSTDHLGPINVAQRVADTFQRVFSKIGIQQHSILREAALEVLADGGIEPNRPKTWTGQVPSFENIKAKLESYAAGNGKVAPRVAAQTLAHISTIFVYNTFRETGRTIDWKRLLESRKMLSVFHLQGLEPSLEKAVTEFLLWNFIAFLEARGPSPLQAILVLDEAHRLTLGPGSPVEKLLREGRKFGVGLFLGSQQPEDFSSTAFSNCNAKIVFQVQDERTFVSRMLFRKVGEPEQFRNIYNLITKLPRGTAYIVTGNLGQKAVIDSIESRFDYGKGKRKV